jgi:hypothetical protein
VLQTGILSAMRVKNVTAVRRIGDLLPDTVPNTRPDCPPGLDL